MTTTDELIVYRLYGHYSFRPRDGGAPVKLVLAEGFAVGDGLNNARLIVGAGQQVSIEEAIHHGYARIVA